MSSHEVEGDILTFGPLSERADLVHGTTTSRFYKNPFDKREMLTRAAEKLSLKPRLIACARQVHGIHIEVIEPDRTSGAFDEGTFIEFPDTDALITGERSVLIGVFTADCVPVLIVDPVSRLIAAVHAGWRGTFSSIVKKTILRLVECGSRTADLLVCLGPAISKTNYEVSAECADEFRKAFPNCPGAVDGRQLDLPMLNCHQAEVTGVPADRIYDCGLSTFAQPELLESYRRDGKLAGRMVSFLMLA